MGPAGFVAVIAGWITTEVGRQPFTVYGLLRTAQSASPLARARGRRRRSPPSWWSTSRVFGMRHLYILRLMAKPPQPGEPGLEPGTPIRAAGITPAPAVDPDRHLQPAE